MSFWEDFVAGFFEQRQRVMTGSQRARQVKHHRRPQRDRRYGKAVNRDGENARRRRQMEQGLLDFSASERSEYLAQGRD